MANSHLSTYALLVTIIVVWGLSWPINKLGLHDMPPLWFSVTRLSIGCVTIFLFTLCTGKIALPKSQDIPFLLTMGLLQMGCFVIFVNEGLLFVDAGRSAILVYSTPFFVTPIAIIFFQEKLTKFDLLGLMLGFLGIVLLLSPWSLNWHETKGLIGNGLLLLAAACWAIAMLHTRYGQWRSSSLELVPWQLLIGSIFVILAAFALQPHPFIQWTNRLVLSGLYSGLLATAFGYATISYVSRQLPVITTSLLLLGVPVLGLLFSALMLDEKITWQIVTAMTSILIGLVCMSVFKKQ
jgi:drug/metabolite transporter (DMT)-like permease